MRQARSPPWSSSRSCSSSCGSAAWSSPAAIALVTVIAAREVFALLTGSGTPPSRGSMALALTVILDAAFPEVLEGSGLLLVAVGIVPVAVAASRSRIRATA